MRSTTSPSSSNPGRSCGSPHQYEETRARLLHDAEARGSSAEALRQRLPTRGQIETLCEGSWLHALEIAGLLPAGSADSGPPVAIVEALLRFYEAEGYLPTEVELVEMARRDGFALERAAGRWHDSIEEAELEAARRGLAPPPPYGTRPVVSGETGRGGRQRHRPG